MRSKGSKGQTLNNIAIIREVFFFFFFLLHTFESGNELKHFQHILFNLGFVTVQ